MELTYGSDIIITNYDINDLIKLIRAMSDDTRWSDAWNEIIEAEEEMTDEDVEAMENMRVE